MFRPMLLLVLLGLETAKFSPLFAHAKGHPHGHGYQVVVTSSLEPKPVCSSLKGNTVIPSSNNRTWLPLYHRHGPCSPFHTAAAGRTPPSTTATILHRDQIRADSIIQRRLSLISTKNKNYTTVPTTLGTPLGTLEYVVDVGLGTPPVRQTVLIDTGSDLSWVQCRPCPVPPCHRPKEALFDPTKSSTYSPIPCGSPACAQLGASGADHNNGRSCSSSSSSSSNHRRPCGYVVQYGDGSNTTGTYGSDTLTVTSGPSGDSDVVVTNFRFGCSHGEPGFSGDTRTDGLLGLGGDMNSLVSQAGVRAFSYCHPATASRTGYLALGAPPRVSSSRFLVTPLYKATQSATYYFVLLRAITVAGRRLHVPPSVFSAGAVMDSGTVITRLPPRAYRALRDAFRAEMGKTYPLAPPPSGGILDTCFNLTGVRRRAVRVPMVALVFDRGVAVELHPSGVLLDGCLAFASNGGGRLAGIIGNVQQRTLEVLYDVGGGAVGFRRRAC